MSVPIKAFFGGKPKPSMSLYMTPVFNTTAGNKSLSVNAAVGDLIIVCCCCTDNSAQAVADDQGGQYVVIGGAAVGGSTGIVRYYARTALVTVGGGHIITCTMAAATGGGIAAYQVKGMAAAGGGVARSLGQLGNQTAAVAPAPVLSLTPQLQNFIFGTCFMVNGTSVAPRAGYTEDFDSTYATPATGWQLMHRPGGETSATITWGGAPVGATSWGAFAWELNISATTELEIKQLPGDTVEPL